MSTTEAKEYVDLVIETLVEKGYITQERYGKMPEALRDELADAIVEKSEE